MALPPNDEIRDAMLRAMADGGVHSRGDVEATVAGILGLSEADRSVTSNNGTSVLLNKLDGIAGRGNFETVATSRWRLSEDGRRAAAAAGYATATPEEAGLAALEREWGVLGIDAATAEQDVERKSAIPAHREVMDAFLDASIDLAEFRSRLDSLSKTYPYWGWRGTAQMFFNQIVKAADPDDFELAFRAALPAPSDNQQVVVKLATLSDAVQRARDRAEKLGVTKPGLGRVNYFLTFFWELQDRDRWPVFYPNSRDVLERYGLLDLAAAPTDLYLTYRDRIESLKGRLGTGTWGVEHLLWKLGKGAEQAAPAPEPGPDPALEPVSTQLAGDLYASFRAQGLHFRDEAVTALALSLATKRFVILSGISGTGKTQIALGLARHLESGAAPEQPVVEPPAPGPTTAVIRLTAPKLQRGRVSLDTTTRAVVEQTVGLPGRGTSTTLAVDLPNGQVGSLRLTNIGFTDESRSLHVMFLRRETTEWLSEHAAPGDYLVLEFPAAGSPQVRFSVVRATGPAEAQQRRHQLIAVRSDWTDPRGLLGYHNPLTGAYVRTTALDLVLAAAEDPERPYFLILDEMNLARVEYYFSDFLSALESGEPIELMSAGVEEELLSAGHDEVPAELSLPPNLSIIGTVNVDETTHAFSPKVLDRANVIEFSHVDIERALGHPTDVEAGAGLRLREGRLDPRWLCTPRDKALGERQSAQQHAGFTGALEDIHHLLSRADRPFGYRVIDEISAFVGHALRRAEGDSDWVVKRAVDIQLVQKVIPKLTGGRELEELLASLLRYSLDGETVVQPDVDGIREETRARLEASDETGAEVRYPDSAHKLLRMLERLIATGYVGALE